jgi:hypothetical protein
LKRIRQICCINLEFIFLKLEPIFTSILHGDNINSISNIYLFLSEFCDQSIFQLNIMYETIEQKNQVYLGKLICQCLKWVNAYRSYNQSIENIEIAILIFI